MLVTTKSSVDIASGTLYYIKPFCDKDCKKIILNLFARMSSKDTMKKVVVVGGGPVGYVAAIYLARDGWEVEVYEKYADPRLMRPECTRSINLTLSHRGEEALRGIDLLKPVLEDSLPAYGRVTWSANGNVLGKVNYGEKGESIRSLRRFELNLLLLNAADSYTNTKVYFNHELSLCDFDCGTTTFTFTEDGQKKEKIICADLFIGADGAHSTMRAEMSKQKRLDLLDFKYHPHGYLEMMIPSKNDDYQLDKNRLHVWPKDAFTLILLPNLDKSFSGTLVMPFGLFEQMLESEESLIAFFKKELNQVLQLVGEKNLIQQFKPGRSDGRKPCGLVSVKSQPYHAPSRSGAKFVLLGDAAHAMVPFYGQGMNTGLEDVQIFSAILSKHAATKDGINAALEEFSANRCKDGQAMSDFSYEHYQALCLNVKKKDYNIRRRVDSAIHKFFPSSWIPEYTLVAFSKIPHSECRQICRHQDRLISYVLRCIALFMIIPLVLVLVVFV